jgi:biotin transport system substrate-specific component
MAVTAPAPRVLADVIPRSLVRDILLIVGGAALVGVLAQLSYNIPGTPILLTGQTFGVLLVGASLGAVRGMASMVLYGAAGLAGIPWFAQFSTGVSPWFGYIIGFIAGAGLVGWLAERGWTRTFIDTALAMVLGNVVIYAFGVVWLKYAANYSWATAVLFGMTVYLLGDGIKILLASGAFPAVWRQLSKRGLAPRADASTATMTADESEPAEAAEDPAGRIEFVSADEAAEAAAANETASDMAADAEAPDTVIDLTEKAPERIDEEQLDRAD